MYAAESAQDRQTYGVQNASNCSAVLLHVYSTLKVHAQCAQDICSLEL